jgi:hypothetical protein
MEAEGPGFVTERITCPRASDQDPPSGHNPSGGETDDESGDDAQHLISDQFDAVAGDLSPCLGQEVGRRHPVAGQEPLHVRGGGVSRSTGVDQRDPPPGPTKDEGRAQPLQLRHPPPPRRKHQSATRLSHRA